MNSLICAALRSASPNWLRDLAGAWVFYSVLPGWPWPVPRFERIARFAPWIGAVIGGLMAALWLLLSALNWPPVAIAPAVLALGLWLTGGLHLDGLMDTADGLGAGHSRCLEAMDDSRVGASGVQAAFIALLDGNLLLDLMESNPAKRELRRAGLRRMAELVVQAKAQG